MCEFVNDVKKKKICKKHEILVSDKCLSQKFPQGNRNVTIEIKAKKNCVKLRERMQSVCKFTV